MVDLEERTLENAGTLTIGEHDRLNGSKRARVVNSGTLNLNANSPIGSEYGLVSVPGEATLVNTGVVQKVEGGEPALCSFAVDNDGTITAVSGTLEFTSGGESAAFASDTWAAAPGTAIELNGISSGVEYSLGTSATITGAMHLDANVTAGAIEGSGALTTLHSILTLTGYTPSELSSLTFLQAPPDVWFPQVQHLSVASELDIDNSLTWSSISAVFEGPGAIVTKPGSTTLFDAGSATFDGGQLINEGTATWETGQLDDDLDYGTFFINRGTFEANAQEFEPLMSGCRAVQDEQYECPVFENNGIFTAKLPRHVEGNLPAWPPIDWRVDIVNYGDLEVNYKPQKECPGLPPYGWSSEQCVNEQRTEEETYEGLLLKEGAEVRGIGVCDGPTELACPGEEEPASGEEGEAAMYPEPEVLEEEEGWNALTARFNVAFSDNSYKETLCVAQNPCGSYKGSTAAKYAERWVLAGESEQQIEENVNHEYNYYGGNGGDCTNFVSQALKAGGLRFMRAHGDDSPDGGGQSQEEADEAIFLKGQGSWWSYYATIPLESSETYVRSYTPTQSFVRAGRLYSHLLEYGLARIVGAHEVARPGDIVFYDLYNTSLAPQDIDHAQLVVKVTKTATWVAQHSPSYVHTLGFVIHRHEEGYGAVARNWDYVILEPTHTAANIGG